MTDDILQPKPRKVFTGQMGSRDLEKIFKMARKSNVGKKIYI